MLKKVVLVFSMIAMAGVPALAQSPNNASIVVLVDRPVGRRRQGREGARHQRTDGRDARRGVGRPRAARRFRRCP